MVTVNLLVGPIWNPDHLDRIGQTCTYTWYYRHVYTMYKLYRLVCTTYSSVPNIFFKDITLVIDQKSLILRPPPQSCHNAGMQQ
jgi:hypothetical protein